MSGRIAGRIQNIDLQIIESVKRGDKELFKSFYLSERPYFLKFLIKNYKLENENLTDIYQEAVLVLYENIVAKKLDNISSGLRTYLYGIGKNLVFKQFNRSAMVEKHESDLMEHLIFLNENTQVGVSESYFQRLKSEIRQLKDPCRDLLIRFYYQRQSLESIASGMGYKNASVVKNQKRRCMEKLKEIMQQSDIRWNDE